MSGRGSLLSLFHKKTDDFSKAVSSKRENVEDGGTSTSKFVENGTCQKPFEKLLENDLVQSFKKSFSIGRGRGSLLQSYRNDLLQLEISKSPQQSSQSEQPISKASEISVGNLNDSLNNLACPNVKCGTKGFPVKLACNYIHLKSDPQKGVYQYEVRFEPPIDSLHLRIKYLNEHRSKFGGTKTFDGTILYLPILLENESTTFISKNVDDKDIEITLKYKKKVCLKDCMHLYNILFDRVMKTLNYLRLDRRQFDPTRPKIIPMAKLEIWPGYITAVQEYDGGLMLCCDVSHRLLCQKTVLELLIEIYRQNKNNFQNEARKYLLGSIVLTRYNNRTYRIDDIDFSQNPESQFETNTGSLSYTEYYKNHYNINIKDLKQPLLISVKQMRNTEETNSIYLSLIPELCYLTGLHDGIRSDRKLMLEIATIIRVTPNQRIEALKKFLKNVSESPEAREILENWGLTLDQSYSNFVGRQLAPEMISFSKEIVAPGPKVNFSKACVNNELLEIVHLKNWLLIHVKSDVKIAKTFLLNMTRCCEVFGMSMSQPNIITLEQDRIDLFVNALRRYITNTSQMVVVICPNSRDDRYAAIKKICCAELPLASQVINARTLTNETKNRSIVQKIILQMNCKMGGSLWSVKIPLRNAMICGIDTYHDPCQRNGSVAAFVASLNSSFTHWYSKAVIQSKKEEIVNGLAACFELALECYKERNGHFPENVIIYRDGIGDGQFNLCVNHEIPQFERACNKNIKITFIIVQKRTNTRFFMENKDNFENPLPGTVVDKHITRPHLYDFFLVSQMLACGTVSPTHFVVLRDDANFGPDIIQKLSYKLCFLYYNWPGAITIPACCMYAHKLAYLIGQSVQRNTASKLSDRLFYL